VLGYFKNGYAAPSLNSCLPIERTITVQKATLAVFSSLLAFHPHHHHRTTVGLLLNLLPSSLPTK
jgi:hypothetical protein